ncbi:DUF2142 domain-containing protein [Burkholderia sp. BCC1993]|uniref:DUF2142 domain-containing protein n=1 Tax=Burkholderia sp. BCC1993 TaxID=2817444 RepID=UPI002AB10A30|nr:DUF2142 domain-containing protein [Burkholderia sp. BCC1993]
MSAMEGMNRRVTPAMLAWIYVCYAVFTGLLLIVITPPFQTPDAVNHFYRATQVSEGHWLGERYPGTSGGAIDGGAIEFATLFNPIIFHPGTKVDGRLLEQAASIRWSGAVRPAEFPNTAIYPPYAYFPQAVAIGIGRWTGLTIQRTYMLACLFGLIASTGLTFWAIRMGRATAFPVFVIALLPMTSMIFSSVSQETLVFPAIFLLATYLEHLTEASRRVDTRSLACIGAMLVLSISARPPYAGLLLLLFCPGLRFDDHGFGLFRRVTACIAIGTIAMAASWVFGAAAWAPVPPPRSVGGQLAYLIGNPADIVRIAAATMREHLGFYCQSFVGILGWLNVHLGRDYYVAAAWMLGFAAAFAALAPGVAVRSVMDRSLLLLSVLTCVGMIFGSLYLTWTPLHAPVVEGVQGRYFVPLAPLFAMALTGVAGGGAMGRRLAATGMCAALSFGLVVFPIYSYAQIIHALLMQYYVSS